MYANSADKCQVFISGKVGSAMAALDEKVERKSERVHARLTPSTKALILEAAELAGRPLSDFLVDAVREKALATIQAHRVWQLTEEQSRVFAEAILDPAPPSPAMRARYRRFLERGGRPFEDEARS
jgi:uncharacterized protein (DUF1778 family)